MWVLVSKNMQKKKKFEICTPKKKQETCLIWSFLAKMNRWQDVTSLSWVQLMLEIKHHRAMIAHLSCLSRSVDPLVDWQMALALLWGTVSPGEGGGEALVGSSSVEEQAWDHALAELSRNQMGSRDLLTQPTPWLGPYRTTNKLKLCHISNFLLALLYSLESLKTVCRLLYMIF